MISEYLRFTLALEKLDERLSSEVDPPCKWGRLKMSSDTPFESEALAASSVTGSKPSDYAESGLHWHAGLQLS